MKLFSNLAIIEKFNRIQNQIFGDSGGEERNATLEAKERKMRKRKEEGRRRLKGDLERERRVNRQ